MGKGVELFPTNCFWNKALLKDLVQEEKVSSWSKVMVTLSLAVPQSLSALVFLMLDVAVETDRFSVPFLPPFQSLEFPAAFLTCQLCYCRPLCGCVPVMRLWASLGWSSLGSTPVSCTEPLLDRAAFLASRIEQEGIELFPPEEGCDDTGPCKQHWADDAKEKSFQ